MQGMHALLFAALLIVPTGIAIAPNETAEPSPTSSPGEGTPILLSLAAPVDDLSVGAPAEVPLVLHAQDAAASPLTRRLVLVGASDRGDNVTFSPNPVTFAAGSSDANATLRVKPGTVGAVTFRVDASWESRAGNGSLGFNATVRADPLAIEGLAAAAPDSNLDVPLTATLRSGRLADEPVGWIVDATYTPTNASAPIEWMAAAGQAKTSPSGEAWTTAVRAKYGAGGYDFRLHAEGYRVASAAAGIHVQVEEVRQESSSTAYTLQVDDAPTTLRFANDTVNQDGKAKSPGTALITRVIVADPNGLGDVRRVTFLYQRNDTGTLIPVVAHVQEGFDNNSTERSLEDRFDLAPMKDAPYVCTITAEGSGSPAVARTFVITDTQAEGNVSIAQLNVRPDGPRVVEASVVVRDGNFGTGPLDATDVRALGVYQLVLYRGSTKLNDSSWNISVGATQGPSPFDLDLRNEGIRTTSFSYTSAGGKGQLSIPVQLHLPEGAVAGSYRLSLVGNSTLGSATFTVLALPQVTRVALGSARAPGSLLAVDGDVVPGEDVEAIVALGPDGAQMPLVGFNRSLDNGTLRWNLTLRLPTPWNDAIPLNLTFLADLGGGRVVRDAAGKPVNARNVTVAVANVPPTLDARLTLGGVDVGREAWVHPHANMELKARIAAGDDNAVRPDLSDEGVTLTAEVRDWNGHLADFEINGDLRAAGATLSIEGHGVPPGRYTLRVIARDNNNASAERNLTIHVGILFRLGLDAPAQGLAFAKQADGAFTAEALLRNRGNTAAASVAVLVEGLPAGAKAQATLELANGTQLTLPLAQGYARFQGNPLILPFEWARLHLRVDVSAGVPTGVFRGQVRVAGEAAPEESS